MKLDQMETAFPYPRPGHFSLSVCYTVGGKKPALRHADDATICRRILTDEKE